MAKDVIIACDFSSKAEVTDFLDKFCDEKPYLKIGMELFYSQGPEIVREIKKRGHKIFLDLKLHDIPNTVERTMEALSYLDIDMCNLHASGGSAMMRAALSGLSKRASRPKLIAVTQLTSTDAETMNKELLIERQLDEVVMSYAKNAAASGLDGVVCSPLEAAKVKSVCGESFLTVTPGVRFSDSAKDDQKRVTTPKRARELGSDYIVVGRPITKAQNPQEAYRRCVFEFLGK